MIYVCIHAYIHIQTYTYTIIYHFTHVLNIIYICTLRVQIGECFGLLHIGGLQIRIKGFDWGLISLFRWLQHAIIPRSKKTSRVQLFSIVSLRAYNIYILLFCLSPEELVVKNITQIGCIRRFANCYEAWFLVPKTWGREITCYIVRYVQYVYIYTRLQGYLPTICIHI